MPAQNADAHRRAHPEGTYTRARQALDALRLVIGYFTRRLVGYM